ncbi:MAG: ACP S-malonyltransferase, partial [Firmicutes bacterium]|nr:ACP S-malonyltransferase [Bacillota bacterium]
VSVAMFRVYLEEIGIEPIYAAGHSLGEISALTCAGGLKFEDALKIVQKRGRFMQEALPQGLGTMSSISGIEKGLIESECRNCCTNGEIVVISNYNSPEQIVISGHKNAVAKVCEKLSESGAMFTFLNVSSACHSPLMQSAAQNLSMELTKYTFKEMKWPVISNVDALPYIHSSEIVDKLIRQLESPVRWKESMDYISRQGITHAIEIGPKIILKNLMKKNAPEIITFSYDKPVDIQSIKNIFKNEIKAGNEVTKNQTVVAMCLAAAVCTRNRNWNNDQYRKGVIEPYQRIKEIYNSFINQAKEPTVAQMKDALNLLRSIFNTKKVPIKEQNERFINIIETTGTKQMFSDFECEIGGNYTQSLEGILVK